MTTRHFEFAFDPRYRIAALPFGILPSTAWVEVDDDRLSARYGFWRVETPRSNVAEVSRSGGYSFVKTAGPAHLSLSDHGVTFASNGEAGVCVAFHEPVAVLDPTGRFLRHPGLTVTVADPDALAGALEVPPRA